MLELAGGFQWMGQAAAGGGGGSYLPLAGGQMTGDILIVTNDYDKPSVRIGPYETGLSVWGNTKVGVISNGTGVAGFSDSTGVGAMLKSTLPLSWSNALINGSPDLLLYRDGAGILAQRNGVNEQEFQVSNTYTDASNYERGVMAWRSNSLYIGSEESGTGSFRNTYITAHGFNAISLLSGQTIFSHNVNANVSNTQTLGAASREWSDIWLASSIFQKEMASAPAGLADFGKHWVKTATPNESWFTDDAGNDQLVSKSGIQRTVQLEEVLVNTSPSDGESEDSEITMHTFSVPAGELATNGDKLIFRARGSSLSTNAADFPSYRVMVDGVSVINTYDFGNDQDSDWRVDLEIIRVSSTSLTICVLATLCADSSHASTEHRNEVVTEAVPDLAANAFNIVVYGTNDGGATDIIQQYLEIVSTKTY